MGIQKFNTIYTIWEQFEWFNKIYVFEFVYGLVLCLVEYASLVWFSIKPQTYRRDFFVQVQSIRRDSLDFILIPKLKNPGFQLEFMDVLTNKHFEIFHRFFL